MAEKILSVFEKDYREINKGIEWKMEGKKLTVSELRPIPDCLDKAPWEEEKDSIQSNVIKRGVKRIGDSVFYNRPKLTAVELHSGLKRIGWKAFMNFS